MKRFFLLIVSLTVVYSTAFAQTQPETNVKPCDPQSAVSIVQTQAEANKTIIESDKRIKILVRIGDFMWKHDEPAARKYFSEAYNLARERYKEKGFEMRKDLFFISDQTDYRLWVLQKIAEKDGKWAEKIVTELSKDLEEEAKQKQDDEGRNYHQLQQILESAKIVFKTNKLAGLNTARIAFKMPFRGSVWSMFLFNLAEVDQIAADGFYAEVLVRFGGENLSELLFLYGYPFGEIRGLGLMKNSIYNKIPTNFSTSPNLQKLFLNAILRRSAEIVASGNQSDANSGWGNQALHGHVALQEIELIVETSHPEFISRIQAMKTQLLAFITDKDRQYMTEQAKRDQNSNLPFAERLKKLEEITKSDDLDVAIINLVFGSYAEEELIQIEPWLEKISDREVYNQTLQFFKYRRTETAIRDKRLDDARKHADKISELEFRASSYLKIADEKLKIENSGADEILSELEKIALKAEDSVIKARVLLGISYLYANFNDYRAVEVLSSAVKTINKLENQDIFTSNVVRKIAKEGKYGYYAVYSIPGFNLETTFNRLSEKNFDATLAESRSLTDKYWQTIAVIATVRGCVENQEEPKKTTEPKPKVKPKQKKS